MTRRNKIEKDCYWCKYCKQKTFWFNLIRDKEKNEVSGSCSKCGRDIIINICNTQIKLNKRKINWTKSQSNSNKNVVL